MIGPEWLKVGPSRWAQYANLRVLIDRFQPRWRILLHGRHWVIVLLHDDGAVSE